MNSTHKVAFLAMLMALSGCASLQKSNNAYFEYQKGDFVLMNGIEEFTIDPYATKLDLQNCLLLNKKHIPHEAARVAVASKSSLLASSVINSVTYYNKEVLINRLLADYANYSSEVVPLLDDAVTFFDVNELPLGNAYKDLSGDANRPSDSLSIGSSTTTEMYSYQLSAALPIYNPVSSTYTLSETQSVEVRFKVSTYLNNMSLMIDKNRLGEYHVDSNSIETSKLASDLIGLVAADLFANSGSCLSATLRRGSFHTTTRAMVKQRKSSYPLEENGTGGMLCLKDEYRNMTEPFTVEVALFSASKAESLAPNGCSVNDAFKVVRLIKKPSNNLCFQTFSKGDLDVIASKRSAFYKAYSTPASHWLVNAYDINLVPIGCATYTASELYYNSALMEK